MKLPINSQIKAPIGTKLTHNNGRGVISIGSVHSSVSKVIEIDDSDVSDDDDISPVGDNVGQIVVPAKTVDIIKSEVKEEFDSDFENEPIVVVPPNYNSSNFTSNAKNAVKIERQQGTDDGVIPIEGYAYNPSLSYTPGGKKKSEGLITSFVVTKDSSKCKGMAKNGTASALNELEQQMAFLRNRLGEVLTQGERLKQEEKQIKNSMKKLQKKIMEREIGLSEVSARNISASKNATLNCTKLDFAPSNFESKVKEDRPTPLSEVIADYFPYYDRSDETFLLAYNTLISDKNRNSAITDEQSNKNCFDNDNINSSNSNIASLLWRVAQLNPMTLSDSLALQEHKYEDDICLRSLLAGSQEPSASYDQYENKSTVNLSSAIITTATSTAATTTTSATTTVSDIAITSNTAAPSSAPSSLTIEPVLSTSSPARGGVFTQFLSAFDSCSPGAQKSLVTNNDVVGSSAYDTDVTLSDNSDNDNEEDNDKLEDEISRLTSLMDSITQSVNECKDNDFMFDNIFEMNYLMNVITRSDSYRNDLLQTETFETSSICDKDRSLSSKLASLNINLKAFELFIIDRMTAHTWSKKSMSKAAQSSISSSRFAMPLLLTLLRSSLLLRDALSKSLSAVSTSVTIPEIVISNVLDGDSISQIQAKESSVMNDLLDTKDDNIVDKKRSNNTSDGDNSLSSINDISSVYHYCDLEPYNDSKQSPLSRNVRSRTAARSVNDEEVISIYSLDVVKDMPVTDNQLIHPGKSSNLTTGSKLESSLGSMSPTSRPTWTSAYKPAVISAKSGLINNNMHIVDQNAPNHTCGVTHPVVTTIFPQSLSEFDIILANSIVEQEALQKLLDGIP